MSSPPEHRQAELQVLHPQTASPSSERAILASLSLAVLVLDDQLQIASMNPAAENLCGQSARRVLGTPLTSLMTFEDDRLLSRMEERDANVSAHAIPIRLRGQQKRRYDVTLAPLLQHADWQVMTLCDATDEQAKLTNGEGEGQSMALRAPEILAHEIKNPLAGIRGAAQLLARKLSNDKAGDLADRALTDLITAEVDRIASLMDDMQSLSRKNTAPSAACNLHEALGRARAVIEAAQTSPLAIRPLAIREEFDPSIPMVWCNKDNLVQVLLNLLTNAKEACEQQPQPQIMLTTRITSGIKLQQPDGAAMVSLPVELRISDNGPGIAAEVRDHLFEPFVTSKKHGQGLGLALVRKLVREMNCRIVAERDEDSGQTHFRLFLPIAQTAPAAAQVQP